MERRLGAGLAVAVLLATGACGEDPEPTPTDGTPSASSPTTPSPSANGSYTSMQGVHMDVETPTANQVISSPLTVRGSVTGSWMFEADFPMELVDANDRRVVIVPAQADGDWMTTDPVKFTATLTFTAPTTDTGTLLLHRNNPSGEASQDDVVKIPVRFR